MALNALMSSISRLMALPSRFSGFLGAGMPNVFRRPSVSYAPVCMPRAEVSFVGAASPDASRSVSEVLARIAVVVVVVVVVGLSDIYR